MEAYGAWGDKTMYGKKTPGVIRSTFIVDDIRAVVKDLKTKGVKFSRAEKMGKETRVEGPIAIEPFGASAFFKDSEGNILMVWQTTM
jgi:predicted enzyme related to lactoylglutathione lyase